MGRKHRNQGGVVPVRNAQHIKIPKAVVFTHFRNLLTSIEDEGTEDTEPLRRAIRLAELSAFDPILIFVDSRWARWLARAEEEEGK